MPKPLPLIIPVIAKGAAEEAVIELFAPKMTLPDKLTLPVPPEDKVPPFKLINSDPIATPPRIANVPVESITVPPAVVPNAVALSAFNIPLLMVVTPL